MITKIKKETPMEIKNNTPSFGAKVSINYRQLKELGDSAIVASEAVKPILLKRGDNVSFSISRAHRFNPEMMDKELMSDMFKPTDRMIITAKKVNTNWRSAVKNLFRLNFSQSVSTHDFSKIGLRAAAVKAETASKNAKSENVFSFILDVLKGPKDSCGPC